jgi:LPS-assembly protein
VLLLLAAAPTGAEEGRPAPWAITADRIISRQQPLEVKAEGQVVVEGPAGDGHGPLTVRADTLSYLESGNILKAQGGVTLKEEGSGLVRAERLLLNLDDRTGRLDTTTISLADQELNFTGRLAEKTGPDSYRFESGVITSCPVQDDHPPTWSIRCREARVTIDGIAVIKHASLRIGNLPVLYTPFLIVPAKTTRQSGFLFPEISQSRRDGSGFTIPLFVNLSPSSDLTFYPGQYSLRGPFLGVEFRHLNRADSLLTLQADYLHDRTSDPGPAGSDEDYRHDGYLRDTHDRYWLRGKGDHYFSPHLAMRFDLDAVSDQDFIHEYRGALAGFERSNREYLKSFNRGLTEASLEYRESSLQLAGRGDLTAAGAELDYVDDSRHRYSEIEPLQTLPRLTMHSRLPLNGSPLSLAWDFEYLNYYRTEGVGYQRLDLAPRLVAPLPLGRFLEGTVAGGMRETAYWIKTFGNPVDGGWPGDKQPNRTTWDFEANLATLLSRDFHPNLPHLQRFSHLIRPNLGYRHQDSDAQNHLPEQDGADRLPDTNQLYWQLNNYFMAEGRDRSNRPYAGQIGHFKLSQSYDLQEEQRELSSPADQHHPFSDLLVDLELTPLPSTSLRYQTALNMYGEGFTSYQLQGHYSNNGANNLQFGYNYARGSANDLSLSMQFGLSQRVAVRYSTSLSLLEDHKTGESLSMVYTPQCWSMEITVTQDSNDRRLMLVFSLAGIGKTLEIDQSGL